MAEIGRVVVGQNQRGQDLAETLVGTAVSLAEQKDIARLFLACPRSLDPIFIQDGALARCLTRVQRNSQPVNMGKKRNTT
jgi:predicted GNAT family N-acyltransferase